MSYQPATTAEERPSAVTTTRHDSWASLVRHPGYARYFAAVALARIPSTMWAYALAVSAGAHASGYLWAAVSLGSVVSAFAFARVAARLSTVVLMAGSSLAMGAPRYCGHSPATCLRRWCW